VKGRFKDRAYPYDLLLISSDLNFSEKFRFDSRHKTTLIDERVLQGLEETICHFIIPILSLSVSVLLTSVGLSPCLSLGDLLLRKFSIHSASA